MTPKSKFKSQKKQSKTKRDFLTLVATENSYKNSIVQVASFNKKIFACSLDKTAKIYDLASNQIEALFTLSDAPTCVATAERRGLLFCGHANSCISVE